MNVEIYRRHSLAVILAAALGAGCGGDPAAATTGTSDEALSRSGAAGAATPSAAQRILCIGAPETISGVVTMVGGGGGLTIATGSVSETVYGLGPSWYWNQNGVARPVVGDSVVAVVSHVNTMDESVILDITVNGQPLALRDPSTCAPLW
jgi:hypothetical protein